MKFNIGGTLECDLDVLLETRLLVQANSGFGKSHLLRRILEKTHGHVQQLVIDTEGEFYTLREKFDYVLVAKEGGDTAADPRIASMLTRRLLELGASAILDISELKPHERILFVRHFAETLTDVPRKYWRECIILFDEAQIFCPQSGKAESLGPINDLMGRARKRGFCPILATLRLSMLHKDSALLCTNKLIGQGMEADARRGADELGFPGREGWTKIRDLTRGDFYAIGPALTPVVQFVHVGETITKVPKRGSQRTPTPPPPEEIKKLLPRLSDLPAEVAAERKSMDDLHRDLTAVRRELTLAKRQQAPPDEAGIERRVVAAVTQARQEHKAALELSQRNLVAIERHLGTGLGLIRQGVDKLESSLNGTKPAPATTPAAPTPVARPVERPQRPPVAAVEASANRWGLEATEELDGPERRILNAVAWLEALGVAEPEQPAVAFLAGYRYGGGGFNNPKARLKGGGLIEYLPGNGVRLTELGRGLAESPDVAPTDAALQEAVLARLEGPHRRLLQPLLAAYPEPMSNDELAEAANYAPNSGGYNNPRGRLKSLGLIEYPTPGMVAARSLLFPERAT